MNKLFICFAFLFFLSFFSGPGQCFDQTSFTQSDESKFNYSDSSWPDLIKIIKKDIKNLASLYLDKDLENTNIIKIFNALRVFTGIPHVPAITGMSPAQYNTGSAQKLVKKWESDHACDNAIAKEALIRLDMSADFLGKAFDQSLLMAGSCTVSLYKTALLVFTAQKVNLEIGQKYEPFPIIGGLVKRIRHRITARLVELIKNTALFGAARIEQPGSEAVLLMSHFASAWYLWTKKETFQNDLALGREKIARLFGKYLFTNLREHGFIPATQALLDNAVAKSQNSHFSLIHQDIFKQVLNDGIEDQDNSLYEQMQTNIAKTAEKVKKDHKSAGTAQAVSNIAHHIGKYDPTCISRIVSVVSGGISGGYLLHSASISAKEFYNITKTADSAFKIIYSDCPDYADAGNDTGNNKGNDYSESAGSEPADLNPADLNITRLTRDYNNIIGAYARAVKKIRDFIDQDRHDLAGPAIFDFLDLCSTMDKINQKIRFRILDSFYSQAQGRELNVVPIWPAFEAFNKLNTFECAILGDLMAYMLRPDDIQRKEKALRQCSEGVSNICISARFLHDNIKKYHALKQAEFKKQAGLVLTIKDFEGEYVMDTPFDINLEITNMGTHYAGYVKVIILGTRALEIKGPGLITLENLGPDETRVITLKAVSRLHDALYDEGALLSVIASPRNENNKPLGKAGFDMRYTRVYSKK